MFRQTQALTHDAAQRLIDAAREAAIGQGQKVSIALCDAGGQLLAFLRMDGASGASVEIALQKARTSALFPFSTRRMGERNVEMPGAPFSGGAIAGAVTLAGGVPIHAPDGTQVGGLGISGAPPDVDEAIALDALAAVLPAGA